METEYHLTWVLTGPGCFGSYLMWMGLAQEDTCWYCCWSDTPEHTFYICERWAAERGRMETGLGESPTKDKTVTHILGSEEVWAVTKKVMHDIMQRKEADERERKALAR